MKLKELSAKVDSYVEARDARLALQRKVDALKEKEDAVKQDLLQILQENKVSVVGGTTHSVSLHRKDKPTVGDWKRVYAYIHETESYDLLQRRLNESAVEARWEEGTDIPGVDKFPVFTLSISKGVP